LLARACGEGNNFGPFSLEQAMKRDLIYMHEDHPLSGDLLHLFSEDVQDQLFHPLEPSTDAWEQVYARFAAGEIIPPPYFGLRVTDPDKLARMTEAYLSYRDGTLPAGEFPDIREVFLDEDAWAMGFAVPADASGEEIIVQACSQCHNRNLDQTISRANFDVDLQSLTDEQKNTAIERLLLPDDHLRNMPPRRFRTLTTDQVQRVVEVLRQ
jgi:mono/diheme cytochrome c family protein